MFLSKFTFAKSRIISILQWVLATPIALFFLVGVFIYIGVDMSSFLLCLILLLFFSLISFSGFRKAHFRKKAKIYNSVFEHIHKYKIPMSEILQFSNKNVEKTQKELHLLIKKSYLINCTLQYGDHSQIILHTFQDMEESEPVFQTLVCASCGASNTIKTGEPRICEYCGSAL